MINNKQIILIILMSGLLLTGAKQQGRFEKQTFFENTSYELNVYRINGRIPDKTMLVIGGIQGNEPTGYLAADHYVDLNLERGSLIMVPRANFNTIIRDLRGYNGDMNRKFNDQNQGADYEEKIVQVLKSLMAEADVLLNLHEGSGFYSEQWVSDTVNPMRYGQSIIADTDIFTNSDSSRTLNLESIARQVIENVNKKIENPEYYFHFNNHNTFSEHTRHSEQRGSATYYALSNFAIPAFGIESSKSITDIETKVRHQIWVINEFMRIFDIVPEVPRIYLEYPELYFVIITINGKESQIVPKGKSIQVQKGDTIEISHIEANYTRGLSVDIQDYGTINDFNSPVVINSTTRAVVRKDKFQCGEIGINVKSENNTEPVYEYIVLQVNDNVQVFHNDENIQLQFGDKIKIIDTVPSSQKNGQLRINLFGFVPDKPVNTADDRFVTIDTGTDLIPQYSRDGEGKEYIIRVERYNEILSTFNVVLSKADLLSVRLEYGDQTVTLKENETVEIDKNEIVKIVDVSTSVADPAELQVNFKGFVGNGDGEDRMLEIPLDKALLPRFAVDAQKRTYPITVSHHGKILGMVYVKLAN